MKRRQVLLVVIVVLLLGTVALSQLAVGNFNAATGFSGRHGFTCTSCHNVPDMGPLGDEQVYDPPAQVTLSGLPEEWDHGQQYELTITVTGGPPAAPDPAPQGGFEIEANGGYFEVPDGMDEFIYIYADDARAVTYTEEGTQMRQWWVTWSTPGVPPGPTDSIFGGPWMTAAPTAATFWVAAMAANGNHVVVAGQSDGGEFGDSVANITVTVPPSQATLDAWQEYRLLPALPDDDLDEETLEVGAFAPFTITGRQKDDDATHIGYSLDGGSWERREASGAWSIPFGNGLTPGEHSLLVRAESGDGRLSDPVEVVIHALEADVAVETSFPSLLAVGALLMAAGWRRRR